MHSPSGSPSGPPSASPATAAIRPPAHASTNSLAQPGTTRRPRPEQPPARPVVQPGYQEPALDEDAGLALVKRTFQYPAELLERLANVAYWSRRSQAEILSDILTAGLEQQPAEWQQPRPEEAREGGKRRRRR